MFIKTDKGLKFGSIKYTELNLKKSVFSLQNVLINETTDDLLRVKVVICLEIHAAGFLQCTADGRLTTDTHDKLSLALTAEASFVSKHI